MCQSRKMKFRENTRVAQPSVLVLQEVAPNRNKGGSGPVLRDLWVLSVFFHIPAKIS